MMKGEARILNALDRAVSSTPVRRRIAAIIRRVERKLRANPEAALAWEPIPLNLYTEPLPEGIRSSWVFILRAGTTTGAERHPNSHQRMMSYRGSGDFQTRRTGRWRPRPLTSDPAAAVAERWISIPPGMWHQGVVPAEDWVVVSFHTAAEEELIEERPAASPREGPRRRRYVEKGRDGGGPSAPGRGARGPSRT